MLFCLTMGHANGLHLFPGERTSSEELRMGSLRAKFVAYPAGPYSEGFQQVKPAVLQFASSHFGNY